MTSGRQDTSGSGEDEGMVKEVLAQPSEPSESSGSDWSEEDHPRKRSRYDDFDSGEKESASEGRDEDSSDKGEPSDGESAVTRGDCSSSVSDTKAASPSTDEHEVRRAPVPRKKRRLLTHRVVPTHEIERITNAIERRVRRGGNGYRK
ncbi:hypothetical protein Agabi119p4_3274 [Agaricus bisporus var. burnettii]|uniref:Uncharacterized protein n=1 Tax=Agaricus bisporus var. burnettii TaxID=192524 RepID=A0A8H7C3H0_AGABI|nr:hypothetical protein Agabi119p4_10363 [Agaricus bisporus var. burnettii]KAF7778929.1 hypothetical protein Agabi119p4_3274 [Agaricus bisporus var. burnettii]